MQVVDDSVGRAIHILLIDGVRPTTRKKLRGGFDHSPAQGAREAFQIAESLTESSRVARGPAVRHDPVPQELDGLPLNVADQRVRRLSRVDALQPDPMLPSPRSKLPSDAYEFAPPSPEDQHIVRPAQGVHASIAGEQPVQLVADEVG
jgi:hypothetical protein